MVLVAAMLARHVNTTTVYAVFCFGHERRLSITAVADGLVTTVTALMLVPHLGLSGVAVASLVGVVTVSYVPNVRVLARELGVHSWMPLIELRGWFVRFALCAGAGAAFAALPLGHGFAQLVTRAAGVSIVYALVMVPFVVTGTLGVVRAADPPASAAGVDGAAARGGCGVSSSTPRVVHIVPALFGARRRRWRRRALCVRAGPSHGQGHADRSRELRRP